MGNMNKRLDRLEAVAGPEPIPPEVWCCSGGWCHPYGSAEVINQAELNERPNSSRYERIILMPDDEQEDVT